MVFNKTVIQVYSGNEPFHFNDFVRGTLRLLNYTLDHNIDLKINISGSEFESYLIVNNYGYNTALFTPKIFYAGADDTSLIKELDAFMLTSAPVLVVTSSIALERHDVYNASYLGFYSLVRFKDYLYTAAIAKVQANLLYRSNPDNLLYGYSIIYVNRDDYKFKTTARSIFSLANQIRRTLDLNKDFMVFSNSIQFRTVLSEYIVMSSNAVQTIDDSDIDIGVIESFPSVEDIIIDYILLMKSKKIFRFSETIDRSSHNISRNIYETAFDINNIVGNLEITSTPLYYYTATIVGCAAPTSTALLPVGQPGVKLDSSGNNISVLNNPSGIVLDASGNMYLSDTSNNRICKLDTSGNLTTYAGSSVGTAGYTDSGNGSTALFRGPTALAIDKAFNLYVADTGNNAIRIIQNHFLNDTSNNTVANHRIVMTVVGGGPTVSSSAVGSLTKLNRPRGIAVNSNGDLYISDTGNHRICKVLAGGSMQTVAGTSTLDDTFGYLSGYLNGQGTNASFNSPTGITVDSIGNIFVADTGNNVIRRVTSSGFVSTVAGSGQPSSKDGRRDKAGFNKPYGIAVDLYGILYVADTGNNMIRRITTDGDVMPVVGSPNQLTGALDGYGSIDPVRALVPFNKRATFNAPTAIIVNVSRQLIFCDSLNNTIRRVTPTFSNPTKIRPIAMQTIRVTSGSGTASTLGPTLSAGPPIPNTITYGHRRGCR